ncbi:MAG: NADH-quinone oxidoreductase subunit NuoF [Kiritimatiellae bacterium]|jgi:NADH-quinone oxidoreductase subunit F|nr:NADH-quinone oxidoreductase subunit NuoF [Kiritimatiellia bacterium]
MSLCTIPKICSAADLKTLREKLQAETKKVASDDTQQILVCFGGSCLASGAKEVRDALQEELEKAGVADKVQLVETGCMGPCVAGPVALVGADRTFYQSLKPEDAKDIVTSHICGGKRVERLMIADNEGNIPAPCLKNMEFFKRQTQVVLRNCGWIDPTQIADTIACDGYAALAKALTDMGPDGVVEQMKKSGLRGRGGAGFPTWLKWSFAKTEEADTRYVLCNADEGDPGAYMDRSVLEGDPHAIIEGMALAAYAITAKQGYVYVRAEYPLAVERLNIALDQARQCGLLGDNIMGTDFCFDLEIRMGSGAFVCGEETALIASIEGKRGEPRPRPPFPAHKGLWGKPTVLNNVETYANVSAIILKGGEWYAKMGTPKSKGTKVFALAGAVRNTGLVEVPIGTTLGELIYDIGGGIPNDKHFKAAQIGGPSGGCIPREHLNVPLDYESLAELGAIMGSGGLIVMDEDTCMVDVARFFIEFVQEESCGKCVPCRTGTRRMLEILERICAGQGEMEDIDRLEQLGEFIKKASLCGLGQTAPNPVLSTIRHFRKEYEQHIIDKHCEAGVCPGLVRAPCLSACPCGVDVPGFVSMVGDKRYTEALKLHRERNPFASVCARVCFHTCEDKCRRAQLDSPVSIRAIKRFMVDQEVVPQVPEVRENAENTARKIAIVGAGPAGLACAYFLARLGYKPVVLESEPRPGGMLVQAIPAYRLPREELAREIRMIEDIGVDIRTEQVLGKDYTLQSLKDDGYEMVYLAIGAPLGVDLKVSGSDARGVTEAMSFLRQYNIRGSVPVGKRVAVIGGGNAAIDAARTALRLGSEEVTVIYRRTREQMPAYAEEIEDALNEGVKLCTLLNPEEFVIKNGSVTGVSCRPMKLGEFDRSGRRRPQDDAEVTTEIIVADQVIMAIGQALDKNVVSGDLEVEFNNSGWVKSDPRTGATSIPWLFAGGDATTGPSSVAEAIGAGERAAVTMDEQLSGAKHGFWRGYCDQGADFDPDAEPLNYAREKLSTISVEKRKHNFNEVEQPWSEAVAVRQAKRCLRCDYGKQPCECEDA